MICGMRTFVDGKTEGTMIIRNNYTIESLHNEVKLCSKNNEDALVRSYIHIEGNGDWAFYFKNGIELNDYEAAVEIMKENTKGSGLEFSLRTKNSRTFLDIQTGKGFETSVDVDLEKRRALEMINEKGDETPLPDLLAECLQKATELSISERDRARRFIAGENVTFGTYTPPELSGKEIVIGNDDADYNNYEEDKSF